MTSLRTVLFVVVCGSLPLAAQQRPPVGTLQPPVTGPADLPGLGPGVPGLRTSAVRRAGAGIRLTAPTTRILHRTPWMARGTFQVRATVHRSAASAGIAAYGLVLGLQAADGHVAFLVRPDGFVTVERHDVGGVTRLRDWQRAAAVHSAQADGTALDVLEVHVDAAGATFVVNGDAVATLPPGAGPLEGAPGVQVETGGDITVSALAVAGDQVVGRAGGVPVRDTAQRRSLPAPVPHDRVRPWRFPLNASRIDSGCWVARSGASMWRSTRRCPCERGCGLETGIIRRGFASGGDRVRIRPLSGVQTCQESW